MEDKNKIILEEIENIAKEKQIDPKVIYDALKEGLLKAYERQIQKTLDNVRVEIDEDQGKITMIKTLTVVAKVEDPDLEIALSEVKEKNPELTIGDTYDQEIPTDNFNRLAILQAIQIFKQSIREAEKNSIYDEFVDKIGTILIGKIESIEDKYCLIRIGRAYAYLPKKNQIPGEKFSSEEPNNHIKFYVEDIIRNKNYGQLLASRAHPGFLSGLLELEVPEFNQVNQDGKNVIEIKEVARIPGVRAKVAIISNDDSIDAVGACIGPKGSRIQTISKELNGERIDVILYDENPKNFIINALAPAKVVSIKINENDKQADVIVPTEQFSLAIGKDGMAAKLVARLTHWKINIVSLEQAQKNNIEFEWNGNLKEAEYDQFVSDLRNKKQFQAKTNEVKMINHKKTPMRKCVVSNQILPKKELIRIVRTKDGEVFVDRSSKANGKGVYLQPKLELVLEAKRKKVLEKALAIKFSDEVYQQIIFEIENYWD